MNKLVTKNNLFVLNTRKDITEEAHNMGIKINNLDIDQIRSMLYDAIMGNTDFWEEYWTMIQNCVTEINNRKIRKEIMGDDQQ